MTLRNYYRIAMQLPFVLPLVIAPFAFGGAAAGTGLRDIGQLLWYSLVLGGLPYAGFLAWQFRAMLDRTDRELVRAIWMAPLRYGVVLAVSIALFTLAAGAFDRAFLLRVALSVGAYLGVVGIVFGYAYVLIAEAGRLLLYRRGLLEPATA